MPRSLGQAGSPTTYRFQSMGTRVTVVVPSTHRRETAGVQALFAEWDRRLSRFRRDSELSAVNIAAGQPVSVSQPTFEVIVTALDAARATSGTFDPLLGARLVELGYDRSFEWLRARTPSARALAPWQPGQWREVQVDRAARTVRIPAGTALDLGGIAKGMAVDAALARLRAAGAPYGAVNAGGDLAVHGRLPGSSGWPIEIDALGRPVSLPYGALATSSVLRRRWRSPAGERHHLLDPRSGMPVDGRLAQATVAAATCRQAEVAAKVALLNEVDDAVAFVLRHGLSAAFVTRQGEGLRVGHWT